MALGVVGDIIIVSSVGFSIACWISSCMCLDRISIRSSDIGGRSICLSMV